jgi:uncharacterized membrane protein YgdD (TMEM256/DUF423 family)
VLSSQASVGRIGAIFAGLSVAAGAFGAHTLQSLVPANRLDVFETAARYQMYHGLALLLMAALWNVLNKRWASICTWLFTAGIVLFSGSLYALSLTNVTWLGAITPLGGVAFLLGWGFLVLSFSGGRERNAARGG